jgi:hypothetical protein
MEVSPEKVFSSTAGLFSKYAQFPHDLLLL